MRNTSALALVLLVACASDDLPPPSSPRDPANARAPEPRFTPGPNPLERPIAPAPGADAPGAAGHAGHAGHGGASTAPAMTNPHAGHTMGAGASGSATPMPMPMPMPPASGSAMPMPMPMPKAP